MRNLLYLIVVIMLISWVLGAFVYDAGALIHLVLAVAAVLFLLSFLRRA
ncbi:lmo0937 family membrane protein [Echinicola sediminis]